MKEALAYEMPGEMPAGMEEAQGTGKEGLHKGKSRKVYPSGEEQIMLARRAKAGDKKANEELFSSVERFINQLAVRYSRRTGCPVDNIYQAGAANFQKALEKYDPERGTTFLTYAGWWFRQGMRKEITEYFKSGVHVPHHIINKFPALMKKRKDAEARLGRPLTEEELCSYLNSEGCHELADIVPVCEVIRPIPFDFQFGDENKSLLNVIGEEPEQHGAIEGMETRSGIKKYLETLPERERRVLIMRFGFDGKEGRTLEETGKKLGMTRERVRQIQKNVLDKAKRNPDLRELWEAME